jgi:hypothetical protein
MIALTLREDGRETNQRSKYERYKAEPYSQIPILSTSPTLMSSLRRSYRPVVFAFECPAMRCATSIHPPFVRLSVVPVARNVWQPIAVSNPASEARRRTMRQTSPRSIGLAESWPVLPITER